MLTKQKGPVLQTHIVIILYSKSGSHSTADLYVQWFLSAKPFINVVLT